MNKQQASRRTAIAQTWVDGDTFRETGKKFGVSHQRVHQIVNKKLVEYHAQRREASRKFVAEYNPTPVCQRCRGPLRFVGKRLKRFCEPCSNKLRVVRIVQARLQRMGTTFQSRGHACYFYLNMAVYLIRKHNLKPEDFR